MKRVYSLDVLRIVATIGIVFHHYQQFTVTFFEGKLNFYGGKFYFGLIVEFFFVLSGFLAYKYVEKEELSFSEFYLPKMKRLLPLVFISSVAYELFLVLYKRVCQGQWILGNEGTVWGVIVNALGIQAGWGFENLLVNNPIWYVSVLLLCQIIFFFLMYLSRKKEIPIAYLFIIMIFVGAGILTYGTDMPLLNQNTARGYYAFFFGLLLAHFRKDKKVTGKEALVSFLLIAGMTYGLVNHYTYFDKGLSYIMTFVYYPALIVLFTWQPIQNLFYLKVFGTLGEITYDVYVWHTPMILLMFVLLEKLPVDVDIHSFRVMLLFVGVMFVVGTMSHYLLDRPIQKLLKAKSVQTAKKESRQRWQKAS